MTKEEILAMEAGEELDRLVATEVMGETIPEFIPENALTLQLTDSPVKSPQGNWLCLCNYDEGDIPTWRPVPYSTDISAAWQVVERITEPPKTEEEANQIANTKFALIWEDLNLWAFSAKEAATAICRAALLIKYSTKNDRR